MDERCCIIGILDSGSNSLTPVALAHVQAADLILGASRTLDLVRSAVDETCELKSFDGQLMSVSGWIDEALGRGLKTVVLTTGDPLCHGLAPLLIKKLGHDRLEVIPTLSTLQVAFSRIGMAWQTFRVASVHGADTGEWFTGATPEHGLYSLLQQIKAVDRLALFTGPQNSPNRVARMMLAEKMGDEWQMVVAAHLDQTDEEILGPMSIAEVAFAEFANPNVVILWRDAAAKSTVTFGLDDGSYQQRKPDKGLITKQEVRAVSLAKLQLKPDSVVWDIGAGSGSVGLEAARLCSKGHVYAIEKNEPDLQIIESNRQNMAITNYTLVHDHAPAGIEQWPAPDAVFIGGSGGGLEQLIEMILDRLNGEGRLVMNFVTLENLSSTIETLKKRGDSCSWEITQMSVSRSKPILDMVRMAAENPVWIISVKSEYRDANK